MQTNLSRENSLLAEFPKIFMTQHPLWGVQAVSRLSDCNWTRTHNHLVRKRTLNHLTKLISLAKWLSVRLRTKWLWVQVPLQSLKKFLFWDFSEWKMWYFLSEKVDGKMIFTDYWKVLGFYFPLMRNMVFFGSRSWWKRLYLLITEKFLF